MKIGLIGIGDIARKAYLPVLTEKEGIELALCTRNKDNLERLAKKYRIHTYAQTVEELIEVGIDAAFISTATTAHYEIAKKLLNNGIHVYIDKPISLHIHETEEIVALAQEKGLIAMVGFNRRFIPRVRELRSFGKANLILMQKNRFALQDDIRLVVVEDFIHVVDTLRFLMDTKVKEVKVECQRTGNKLDCLVIQLIGDGSIAIGIMNRNGGVTEELIEYNTGHHKYVVDNLVETTHFHNKEVSITKFGDWEPTLYKRGFYTMVDHFIESVANGVKPSPSIEDSLLTHEICERIVKMIDANL